MPSPRPERSQFARFRLVSRSWKTVADMFLFKDMEIVIRSHEGQIAGYYGRQHRFLDHVFRSGYSHLIRNIYLEVCLYDYHHLKRPLDEPDDTALLLYTDLVCELLLQHSYHPRQLFVEMDPESYCKDEFHTSI